MTINIELTKEDLAKLYKEKEININTKLIYKENKIDDLDLFFKILKEDRKNNQN